MLSLERIETERDTWTVGRWSPAPSDAVHGFVQSVFYWHGLPERPRERVFPNGCASLIVQLDDCYRPGQDAQREPYPPLCVDGLYTQPLVVEAPPRRARVIGVSLTPIGAVKILNTPLGNLNGVTNALDDLLGRTAGELGDRVSGAVGARACIATAVSWLRARVERSREIRADVAWLVRTIEAANGRSRVRALMESASGSASRLSGAFTDHFGLGPKRFARIVRFRNALDRLASLGDRFTGVAGRAGYYDQAHFNAEFKVHAGMTPSQFLAAQRYPGAPSLAEGDWDVFSNTGACPER